MYYSPVRHFTTPKSLSFDLHVLGAPPAFVLSQDQTLKILLLFTRATTSTHFFFAVLSAMQLSKNDLTGKLRTILKRPGNVKGILENFRERASRVHFLISRGFNRRKPDP